MIRVHIIIIKKKKNEIKAFINYAKQSFLFVLILLEIKTNKTQLYSFRYGKRVFRAFVRSTAEIRFSVKSR